MISATVATILDEIAATLAAMGSNNSIELQQFVARIQPEVDAAVKAGDLMCLNYLRDRLAMEIGNAQLNLNAQERLAVLNTVITVARILIKVALVA